MNYKPNEATLIAYLYGELDEAESAKVKAYLNEHADARMELEGVRDTLSILGKMPDKEVIAPPLFMDPGTSVIPLWHTRYFRMIASIAASLLLILVAGRLAGVQINYSNSELRISFGAGVETRVAEQVQPPLLTQADVKQMIDQAVSVNNEQLQSSWSAHDLKLQQSIKKVMQNNSSKINELVAKVSAASQEQVREYVATMQQQNTQLMRDYFQLTASEQKQYVENLLVDFSKYLQEQRTQDLLFFQARMSNIERNTDQFKQETEQILGTIIANGSLKKETNNY
ncbi:MAG: anti-sigma factor [Cyclobacteriaceae bacterium]